MSVTRRQLIGIAATSLLLAGCGQTQEKAAETQAATTEETPKVASVGEAIPVSTPSGDLTITFEGFEVSPSMTESLALSNLVADGKSIACLLMVVENVSYDTSKLSGYADVTDGVWCEDEVGIGMSCMDSAIDYGEYDGAAGGIVNLPEGRSARVALLYQVDPSISKVTAYAGDVEVPIDVAQGE